MCVGRTPRPFPTLCLPPSSVLLSGIVCYSSFDPVGNCPFGNYCSLIDQSSLESLAKSFLGLANGHGAETSGASSASLCGLGLHVFALDLLPRTWISLTSLDVSHNELFELPGLENLISLTELNLCRNSFRNLPSTLRHLPRLTKLNAYMVINGSRVGSWGRPDNNQNERRMTNHGNALR